MPVFLLLVCLVAVPFAVGQGITTGGISGTVVDPAGAVLPGASITAVNQSTNEKYTQTARSDGEFSFQSLPLGVYTVTIAAPGFDTLTVSGVNVTIGTLPLGNEALKIGKGVETVEASAVAPMLSTEQSQQAITLESEQLENLPFNSGFDTVALLQPGVAITHDNSFSNSNGSYGGFSSQGERGRSNNFEIDGQSNNDNSVAGPQVFFGNQDALSGIEVITNNFGAQYGRNAGSVVNYLTKSGTKSFHGSVFEYNEGNWGESFAQGEKSPYFGYCPKGVASGTNGCTTATLARFVQNNFGFTIGGPVPLFKDKLWFFSSGYWVRFRQAGGETLSGPEDLTPDSTGLSQLAAKFPGQPGVAALENNGPYTIKTGNPIAVGTPVSVPVTVGATTANIEMAEIGRSVPSFYNDEELLERMDWAPTSKDHVFVRYFYQLYPDNNAGGSVPAGSWYNVPDFAHSVGGDWSHTMSPSIVNQLRYSFQETSLLFQGGANPQCVWTTPADCTASIGISHSSGTPGILGFGYATNIPQGRTVKVTQVQDNVTWSHGRQTILFGGEWDYQNSPNPFLPDYNGAYAFNTFSDFISGTTNSFTLGNSNGFSTKFTEPDAALYFQDDYKVKPDLTLNLGMRWEFFGQAVNLLHNETVARESNPATAFWDQSLPLSVRTVAETPDHWKQFQPRLGFAYNPEADKKLVVRGGFSVNFDPAFYNMFLNSATSAPVVNLGTINGCGPAPLKPCLPTSGATGAQVRALGLPYLPTGPGINPGGRNTTTVAGNFHNPYTLSWELGLSHQIGNHAVAEVTYVGNHQVGDFQSINANPGLSVLQAADPSAVPISLCSDHTQVGYGHPDCTHANVRERTNTAYGLFEALESKITSQSFHGLTGTLAFTYGKTIDNTSEVFSTETGGNTIAFAQNPLDLSNAERAVSGDSEKIVTSSGFGYTTPKINMSNGLLQRAVNGYRLDTIWTFNTGAPASFFQYGFFGDGPALQSYSDAGFANWQLGGVDTARPAIGNPKAPINTVGVYDDGSVCGDKVNGKTYVGYVNWADCTPTTLDQVHFLRNTQLIAGMQGSPWPGVGRNSLRTYAWNNFDVSIQKQTKITEKVTMNFSAIGYNALNRQYLGTPDTFIDDVGGTFMDYRNSYGSNRNIQLKAQFQF